MMAVCAIGFALASCVADEETLEPLNIGAPVARSHLAAMHSASVQCGALQSGRTCEALGWAVHHDTIAMECVCSLGIANEETAGRCRLASHQDAAHACHARHARQCSAFEFEAGAASAISCRPTATRGGSHHAWSSTPCGDGKFFAVRPGAKMLEPDRATTCESASAERSVVCCADAAFPWAPAASATGAPFRELHPPRLQLPAPILEFHISEASERLGRPLFGVARFPPLPWMTASTSFMCTDTCMGMCMDLRLDMCGGLVCVGMRIDMCMGICVGTYRCVHARLCKHMWRAICIDKCI